MADWKTIKVPPEDKERADEYRPEDSTWGDCLVAGAERLNDHLDSYPPPGSESSSGDIKSSLKEIEERIGKVEERLEEI